MENVVVEQNVVEVYGTLNATLSITVPYATSAEEIIEEIPHTFWADELTFCPINSNEPLTVEVVDGFEPELIDIVYNAESNNWGVPLYHIVFRAELDFSHTLTFPYFDIDREQLLEQYNDILSASKLYNIRIGEGYAEVLRWDAKFMRVFEDGE